MPFVRCFLYHTTSGDATVFLFPENQQLRLEWAAYCRVDAKAINGRQGLCMKHFSEDQIHQKIYPNGRTRLKRGALPCVPYDVPFRQLHLITILYYGRKHKTERKVYCAEKRPTNLYLYSNSPRV